MYNIELEQIIQEWSEGCNKKLIKKIAKLSSAKIAYTLCKIKYRETNDCFYIKSMRKINLFYSIKTNFFLYKEKIRRQRLEKRIEEKASQLRSIISDITKENNKFVYILQHSFFDTMGKNYFSGGGERYACDLGKIIADSGFIPILIQRGDENAEECWVNNFQDLKVIGVNGSYDEYIKIISMLQKPSLTIYSGVINWGENEYYHPSILISHGITWDHPFCNADVLHLKKMLNLADIFVSVDTNTISWFRSTYSKDIKDLNVKMKYIPNYVDLEKYTPIQHHNKRLKITYPRRCSDERGFWLVADIVPVILDAYKDVEFDFIGFAHTEEIKHKIEELKSKYGDRVNHFVIDADKMPEIYKHTDITVIPTLYSEGTSLSCIEAMASGNAIVSTDIGGLPNLIINNYNGLLVEPDKDEIFEAIEKLILNPDLREKFSKNAISVASAFSKTEWQNNWKQILDKIFKNKKNGYEEDFNNPYENNIKDLREKAVKSYKNNIKELNKVPGLKVIIKGKNNVINIDKSARFVETTINIDSNNSYINIKNIKYMRYSTIFIYNGDNQSVTIEDGTSIEGATFYTCSEGSSIRIEKNCMLANGISLWSGDGHAIIDKSINKVLNNKQNNIVIGENSWLAQDCKLLKNAKIPPNTIIGASSIVTKPFVDEYTVIAGNPAKVVKTNVTWDRKDPYVYGKENNACESTMSFYTR